MSVLDKREWLKTAVKKSEGTVVPEKKSGSSAAYAKATSDVVHCRDESRDEGVPVAKTKSFERCNGTRLSDSGDSCNVSTSIGSKCHILFTKRSEQGCR